MTYGTLKTIERTLTEAINRYENELEGARSMIDYLLDEKEKESKNFRQDDLDEWQCRKKTALNKLSETRQALEDFSNHDFR